MNDRLKFRCWNKQYKCYFYLEYSEKHNSCGWVNNELDLFYPMHSVLKCGDLWCNPEQCTELRDKKDVYMFENDIAIYQGTIVGFIQYGNGAFILCSNEFEDTYMPLFEMYIEEECVVDLEIIGSIHENPELLEK